MSKKIAVIGECMIELSEKGADVKRGFGGDTLNTSVYIARQVDPAALTVHYVTALGTDSFSQQMLDAWHGENVDTSLTQRMENRLPEDSTFASMCEFGPLWLDDFGTGMANFSALSEVRYDYIKIARELFVMLRQSPEGRTLFSQLLHLMNRYCRGVIVEGVETPEEWRDVQNSPAFAAQGWFLSRPAPIETLNTAVLAL